MRGGVMTMAAILIATGAAGAIDPEIRCRAAKLKATATRASDLAKCTERALLGGRGDDPDPACVAKAKRRFDHAVAKAEAGGGPCAGDPGALADAVATCVAGYVVAITPSTSTTSTTSTTLPCTAGQRSGDACWFLGERGEGCDAACARQGLAYDPETAHHAGSGGSADTCRSVLLALGVSFPFGETTCPGGVGCVAGIILSAPVGLRCTAPPTEAASSHPDLFRACACR